MNFQKETESQLFVSNYNQQEQRKEALLFPNMLDHKIMCLFYSKIILNFET